MAVASASDVHDCRFVADVKAQSSYPGDNDLSLAVMQRLRDKAAEMAGNAVVVQSLETTSAEHTVMSVTGKVYACSTWP